MASGLVCRILGAKQIEAVKDVEVSTLRTEDRGFERCADIFCEEIICFLHVATRRDVGRLFRFA